MKEVMVKKRHQKGIIVYILLVFLIFIASCNGQDKKGTSQNNLIKSDSIAKDTILSEFQMGMKNYDYGTAFLKRNPLRISEFVRRIFQDKKGHLWFGTNGDGVIRYNGDTLEYFTINEGFSGHAVRGIVGDEAGHIWFGTEGGLSKYDGTSFTNFNKKDGLINNNIWSLTIDRKGIIWIGTLEGVSCFDGKTFTPFDLPEAKSDFSRGVTSSKIVHCIMEDSRGRMWFGTNGGAYIKEGNTLSNKSEKDGLCNDDVNDILEDKDGNIWFATHHSGVCYWNGSSFRYIGAAHGVQGSEAWSLYKDQSDNIWFPIEQYGLYRYDAQSFTNFHKNEGLASHAIQCIFEDQKGQLWAGGWLGLFRFDEGTFVSVTKEDFLGK